MQLNKKILITTLFACMTIDLTACNGDGSSTDCTTTCSPYNLPAQYLNNNNPAYFIANQSIGLSSSMPTNFRNIEQYKILASAQFSLAQFQTVTAGYSGIIDVDLRSEYHGFTGAIPTSFKALPNDDVNAFRTQNQTVSLESYIYNTLLPAQGVVGVYSDDLKSPPQIGSALLCAKTTSSITESQAMSSIGILYYRIAELDHIEPSVQNLDDMVTLFDTKIKNNPNQWVYLHCQGGDGRTTTATAELIMLKQKQAGQLQSFDSIITYTQNASNGYALVPTCQQSTNMSYTCQGSWNRYETLQLFYRFVNTRNDGELFSQWLSRQ